MKHALRRELLRKPISWAILPVYAVMVVFLVFFNLAEMTGFYLLYVLSRYAFYLDAALAVIAFLSCSAARRSGAEEVISACRGKGYYRRYTIGGLLIAAALFQLTLLAGLFAASAANDGTSYFFGHFWLSYLDNLLLPMLICIEVGGLLSVLRSTQTASVLLVLFLLAASPAVSLLSWENQPAVPVDKVLSALLHPFRLFYENGSWAPNTMLGLQTDSSHGGVLLFWLLELVGCLCFLALRRGTIQKLFSSLAFAAALCFLAVSYLPVGNYRLNDQWDSVNGDYHTYETQEAGFREDAIDYTVAEYDLSLSFRRILNVDGTIRLTSESPRDEFVLTLYHGYELFSLTGEDCAVTWSKDGDYVTVRTESPMTDCILRISYSGSHKIFYSGSEGACLPGWFLWYPMPGERQIFLNFETLSSCYNTFNRVENASITLRADGRFSMVTNLEEKGGGVYSGVSDSITLIGGELLLTEGQVKDCIPFGLAESAESWTDSIAQSWQTVCDELEAYSLILPTSRDCAILVASDDLNRLYGVQNSMAIFGDYILITQGGVDTSSVIVQLALANGGDSLLAQYLCGIGGAADTPAETYTLWQDTFTYLLPEEEQNDIEKLLKKALDAAANAGQEENAVKSIVQYVCTEGSSDTEAAFLEGLCEEYGTN